MTRVKLLIVAGLLFGVTACGGDSSRSVVSPTPTPPVVNFQGQWLGSWAKGACTENAGLTGFCGGFNGGSVTITLTQSGSSAQGTLQLGAVQLNVSGPVNSDGSLSLSGQGTVSLNGSTGTTSLTAWRSTVSGNTMAGSFLFVLQVSTGGIANVNGTLQDVRR